MEHYVAILPTGEWAEIAGLAEVVVVAFDDDVFEAFQEDQSLADADVIGAWTAEHGWMPDTQGGMPDAH